MLTVADSVLVWMRRLLASSPLVRGTDRIQAALALLCGVLALCAVPFAGTVGTNTYDHLSTAFAAERVARQQIDAIAVQDSREDEKPYETGYVTTVAWNFGGITRTADVGTRRLHSGDTVSIWIDSAGNRTARVPTDTDAAAQAVIAALGLWATVIMTLAALWCVVRMRLDKVRDDAWDRDLQDIADNNTA